MECDLSEFFERRGQFWVMVSKDGRELPVLFCPFCGERIPYPIPDDGDIADDEGEG